jgi:hypothetical protein
MLAVPILGGLHHQYTEREFPIVTGLFGFKFSSGNPAGRLPIISFGLKRCLFEPKITPFLSRVRSDRYACLIFPKDRRASM